MHVYIIACFSANKYKLKCNFQVQDSERYSVINSDIATTMDNLSLFYSFICFSSFETV